MMDGLDTIQAHYIAMVFLKLVEQNRKYSIGTEYVNAV